MQVTTVRLDKQLLDELDDFAIHGYLDRTTVLRQALAKGLRGLRLELALQKYVAGEVSAWKAATLAKVTLWDFLDFLKQKGVGFKTDEAELKKQLKEL